MSFSKVLTGAFVAAALLSSTFAQTATNENQLDLPAIIAAGPPPEPSIAINVASQTVEFDLPAAEAAAAADQSAVAISPSKVKRNVCDAQIQGAGPVPSPDTDQAFLDLKDFSAAATSAKTPKGYKNTFQDLKAENNALGYMGYTLLDSYDVQLCSEKCDAINGCAAFNVAFERAPTQDPSPKGGACENPSSTTLIKCVFWGGPVTSTNAVNAGQYRGEFHVVIAGSNGYVNQTVDAANGYTGPNYLGNTAIDAPNDCNGQSTYIGNQYWNDGKPFDTRRCAAACTAQTNTNPLKPCHFFNTYVISKGAQSMGQYCALYTQEWDPSYATLSSVKGPDGSQYSVSYSYTFTDSKNNGLPCVVKTNPITFCKQPGKCGTYQKCNSGQNCFCGIDILGISVCFQDIACGLAPKCSKSSECGLGSVCLNANNCCGYGICVANTLCLNGINARHIFRPRQDPGEATAVFAGEGSVVAGDESTIDA